MSGTRASRPPARTTEDDDFLYIDEIDAAMASSSDDEAETGPPSLAPTPRLEANPQHFASCSSKHAKLPEPIVPTRQERHTQGLRR